eukprot:364783-Chlamydomonas_euryale.AAC.6
MCAGSPSTEVSSTLGQSKARGSYAQLRRTWLLVPRGIGRNDSRSAWCVLLPRATMPQHQRATHTVVVAFDVLRVARDAVLTCFPSFCRCQRGLEFRVCPVQGV